MNKDHNYIPSLRCANQQLTVQKFKTARELAGWMGAIQAQDYQMSKWAFGIRLVNATESSINREIDSGSIIRTHLLRPTWHFVSADDIYWILELTAPRIRAVLRSRDKSLELTEAIYKKSNRILERSLRDGNHLVREDLIGEFKKEKIRIEENRAAHILMRAELEGIICSGKQKSGKPTYAILEEWVPVHRKKDRQEALKELALRYFTSHGPATIHDFCWWSGLTMADAKQAIEYNREILISDVIENQTFWMTDDKPEQKPGKAEIIFLPAYDEFLISYRDRTASLSLIQNKNVVSNNGIFYPVIIRNGIVIGTWKRNILNKRLTLARSLFNTAGRVEEKMILKGIKRYSDFIGREITPLD